MQILFKKKISNDKGNQWCFVYFSFYSILQRLSYSFFNSIFFDFHFSPIYPTNRDFHLEGASEWIRHDFPSHANSFVWPVLVTSVCLFDFHQTELGRQTNHKLGNCNLNDPHSLNQKTTSFFMRFVDTWYPFVDLNIRCLCRPSREGRCILRHS